MSSRFEFLPEIILWCTEMLEKYASAFAPQGQSVCGTDDVATSPTYNLMADALEWTDEAPVGLLKSGELKQLYTELQNARTSIILGQDKNGLANRLLQVAEELFPNWPAVSPDRREISLADFFVKLQSESSNFIDRTLKRDNGDTHVFQG